jgi:hypothetical protein
MMTVTTAAATTTMTGVTVSCPVSTMVAGSSTTCKAVVAGTGSYSSAVTWSAVGGSITSGGVVTGSTSATSVTVVATSNQDSTKSERATITLTQPSTVNGVKISCPGSTLPVGKSMPCTAAITGTGNPSLGVVWSTSAGTITQAGVVTAPLKGTTLTLTATSTQDPTKTGSATLQLVPDLAIVNPTFFATPTTIVVSWNLTQTAYSGVNYDEGPGTPYSTTPAATAPSTHASFTFTGLTPGTTYNATIFSTNQWGTVSMQGSATTPLK